MPCKAPATLAVGTTTTAYNEPTTKHVQIKQVPIIIHVMGGSRQIRSINPRLTMYPVMYDNKVIALQPEWIILSNYCRRSNQIDGDYCYVFGVIESWTGPEHWKYGSFGLVLDSTAV